MMEARHRISSHHPTLLLLQETTASFRWAYVWLSVGGIILVLSVLAFGYVAARRHFEWAAELLNHEWFRRADRLLSERAPWLWGFIRRRFDVHEWRGLALTAAAIVFFGAIYLFALISESWVEEETLYSVDQTIYQWLLDAMHPQLTSSMALVTKLGDAITVTIVTAVLILWLLIRRDRWDAMALVLSVGAGAGVMHGLKWIFDRTRPIEQLINQPGHSFPSGHAFLSVSLYGFVIYLVWRHVESDLARIVATMLLVLIILFVGLSRVMLRVHWVSDVAGGFTVGIGWLVCSLVITRAVRARVEHPHTIER